MTCETTRVASDATASRSEDLAAIAGGTEVGRVFARCTGTTTSYARVHIRQLPGGVAGCAVGRRIAASKTSPITSDTHA